MDAPRFSIELIEQHWISGDATQDVCSHGSLALSIGGVQLADGTEDYGVSETALALLRTLDHDHTPESPVADRLVPHGCGTILMMGCPIGINWVVRHKGDVVVLSDAVVHPSPKESESIGYPDATTTVCLDEYRARVLAFAKSAQALFSDASPKSFEDDFDRDQYRRFWEEFDTIVERHV